MSCPLTQGYSALGCKTGPSGIKRVMFSEYANKNAAATVTAGVVTAFALDTGTQFREYVLHDKSPGFWSDDLTEDNGSYAYNPIVEFDMRSIAAADRLEVKLLAQNPLMIIIERNDGVYNLFGYNSPMNLKSATANSGTGWTDFKGQKLRFEGMDSVPVYELSSTLIATLLAPAV